ncbi:hypothetical protein ACH4MG_05780 [Streptomyces sp. NPDC017454]|uniref:hypothetical protein n=1 Tax=Streptomyces sp. NPDC017454 TaxID=3364997 RepID=UPI0037A2372F
MRLFTPASPRPAAAAALLAASASAALAHAGPDEPLPACTAPDDHTFPLTTRIHGGPAGYEAGGGHGTWYLDLTNTTSRTCEGIHPVVVLVDEKRALEPSQPRLEFYDGSRPHPVDFETTDRDELIGAFGEGDGVEGEGEGVEGEGADGFPGFTVGPGETLTVKVRLALTSDTAPNQVTANAAVVQRRGGDGEWIGQSNDYRFRVGTGESAAATSTDPARPTDSAAPTDPAAPSAAATPDDQGTGLPFADELAGTGLGRADAALGATVLLVAAGGAAVLLARRRR